MGGTVENCPQMYVLTLIAVFAFMLATPCISSRCYANFGRDLYPSCTQLSANVSLHWVVQGGTITWAVDVDGVWDWIGIGISEGGMLGADMAIAMHDSTAHQWRSADYWSSDFVRPQLDTQQDVSLVSISRQLHSNLYGSTLVAMRRPLVSCDSNGQDRPVLNDTLQTVVFAYGTGDFGYHGPTNRGQADVTFLPNTTAAPAAGPPPPLQTLDIRMPAFEVPTEPTTYQCVNLPLPSDAKYHIYSYEPLIDNAALVHHFVMYTCRGNGPPPTALGQPYDCLDTMECEDFYMGWAPGVGKVDAPAAAALAFGRGTVIQYIALQIHYTNLGGVSGQNDSSGFRLSYSSTLKQYDMGVLTLGSYDIAVPPGAPSWSTPPNVCPGGCTTQLVAGSGAGPGGLVLVESFYHMHELGRSMITRHVRNGAELPPLGSRDYFGFDYQSPIGIPPGARQLLPGDLLITTCTYSGLGRTSVTSFGLASYEEMCFNFLTYYPYNPNITDCMAVPLGEVATCSTPDLLEQIEQAPVKMAAKQAALQEGRLVLLPKDLTYSPYRPTCTRSTPSAPGGGSAMSDDGVDSGYSNEKEEERHRQERNVGGAVAAILIVTGLGAVAIVAVYRVMRKKRQAEEEQHLFEKYNPNSLPLPIQGFNTGIAPFGVTAAGGSSPYGQEMYGNVHSSTEGTKGGSGGSAAVV